MKKSFLAACILLLALGLLVDNSLFSSQVKRVRAIASSTENSAYQGSDSNDLSQASPKEFRTAFKYSLITPIELREDQGSQFIRLGNFMMAGTDGQKVFVCNRYPTLVLTFEADGIASAGDIPRMETSFPCRVGEDTNMLEPLVIPYEMILRSPLTQKDFTTSQEGSYAQSFVHFHNVYGEWPTQWNLVKVALYSEDEKDSLEVTGYEVIAILGQSFSLQWKR